jgi:hypothetical protein
LTVSVVVCWPLACWLLSQKMFGDDDYAVCHYLWSNLVGYHSVHDS